MTRGEIRNLARKRLGETTSAFWSDTELNDWIDEAGHACAKLSKSIRTSGKMTTVEDQAEYTVSTHFPTLEHITRVELYKDGDKWIALYSTSRTALDQQSEGWVSSESSTPRYYYWVEEEDIIGLYPSPNSLNAGTDYLKVYYANDYTDITDDNVSPALPVHLHMALVFYVCAEGFGSRGYGEKENDMWTKYYGRTNEYLGLKKNKEDDDDVTINYRNFRHG